MKRFPHNACTHLTYFSHNCWSTLVHLNVKRLHLKQSDEKCLCKVLLLFFLYTRLEYCVRFGDEGSYETLVAFGGLDTSLATDISYKIR